MIVSDVHIFRKDSNIVQLYKFVATHKTKIFIGNGDIIDVFKIWKHRKQRRNHLSFLLRIYRVLKFNKTKIIYIIGNHDYHVYFLKPIALLFGIHVKLYYDYKGYRIMHGHFIEYILRWWAFIGKIKLHTSKELKGKSYSYLRLLYYITTNKKLITGHHHQPQEYTWGVDCGDWVKNNSYIDDNFKLKYYTK